MYPADQSFMSDTPMDLDSSLVRTLNEGTREYMELGVKELITELDIPGLVKKFGPKADDKDKRKKSGNFQRNFGVACGQNLAASTTDADTLKFSGCSHPRLNKFTEQPDISRAFDIGWKVGKLMGIEYCKEGFANTNNPHAKNQFDYIQHMMGKTTFAAFSLCLLKEDGRIIRHPDHDNDPELSDVLNITQLLFIDGEWVRASLIFYMRKSISDMALREAVCAELVAKCTGFLDGCRERGETYRLPAAAATPPEVGVRSYFETGVGSDGMIVTIDTQTSRIVSAALRSKASANKQGNFLAPIACALTGLLRQKKMQLNTEFVELISVLGYLNNIYQYVTVLSMMQSDWDRTVSLAAPGGLVEYVFNRIIALRGCVTGGTGRRCQTFIRDDIHLNVIQNNCHNINDTMKNLRRDQPKDRQQDTTKALRNETNTVIGGLATRCKFMGPMSVTHMVQSLCFMSLAPEFLLTIH